MKKKGGQSSSDDLSHMLETVHDDLSKMLEESVTEDDMSMSMDFGESSTCESLPQNQAVLELVSKNAATTNLKDPTTSRGKAFQWLTTFKRTLDPCGSPPQTLQLYSLLVFYYATGGSNWTKNDGWLKDENYCSWYGVTCDLEDKVFELTLDKNNLQGTLPQEISLLDTMESFGVYQNALSGTVPNGIVEWTELRLLDLEDNQFTGPAFPDKLSQWSQLESYQVSNNDLTGPMISDFYALPELRKLWVAGNKITGSLPKSLMYSTKLQSLVFYDNMVAGNIPPEIGKLNLTNFLAFNNLMAGTIPEEFYGNTNLVDLRIENNTFSGTISSALGNLVRLQSLRLGDNGFQGTIPTELKSLSNLVILSMNGTSLSGSIPDAFGTFQKLEYADFSNAYFTGQLPRTIFDIPSISALYFNDNFLTGSIPGNYLTSSKLRDLYLSNNRLNGTLPDIKPGQSRDALTELLIDGNEISGQVPASICELVGFTAMERDTGVKRTAGLATRNEQLSIRADHCNAKKKVSCDCCTPCPKSKAS
ncbi:hypothetical protein FisN_19Hh135 [Fistulifera solaris]|uniref:Leucine-rich repeat-containing N-terminal plant-type domain-containing protein n=1 Tax=Fistulifera solaris TaxID=1519565 RepID=A0A1Z5JZY7_FISSO|nr:hypothetical protein FisN_19Hh135 [Fistulifera solaris]|eukprot:GAX19557.1 hypothetical protein FisN_19Hh135 [Fistulifera solaris]